MMRARESTATYSSFGRAFVDAGATVENDLRLPGQYYDSETGLHYNWHRYYDPYTGRYLTSDPIGFEGGINIFSYARENPIRLTDTMGLSTTTDLLGVVPIIGTIMNIVTNPAGSKIMDYQIMKTESNDPISIQKCKQNVALQAATYAGQYHRLMMGHDIIDATAAGAATLLGGVPIAAILMIDAGIDTAVSIYKTFAGIYATANKAAKLCEKNNCP